MLFSVDFNRFLTAIDFNCFLIAVDFNRFNRASTAFLCKGSCSCFQSLQPQISIAVAFNRSSTPVFNHFVYPREVKGKIASSCCKP
jgi:hypothetical protein